ncbi:MAG: hypothetical protein ACO3Y3_09300 [Phycisphaerales bacterium]|jgi:hypothetical protein
MTFATLRTLGLVPMALLLLPLLATACAGLAKDDRSVTGGRTLELRHWIPAEQKVEYYSIDRNGLFGAAGGRAAEFKEITWTTQLSSEQLAEFLDPPSETSWWDRVEAESKASDDAPGADQRPRTELDFKSPSLNRRLTARGRVPQIESMLEAMRAIAMGRFAPELDALPRAGERF